MMPKIFYKYSEQSIVFTDLDLQKNEIYLQFVQRLMKKGKKSRVETLFRQTPQILEQKDTSSDNVFALLEKAVKNTKPAFFLKKARIGGTSQQIPSALDPKKKEAAAVRALLQIATEKQKRNAQRKDSKTTFADFLATELYEASQGFGAALQKRDELHKLAEANRALLTQRWW